MSAVRADAEDVVFHHARLVTMMIQRSWPPQASNSDCGTIDV
jgi:hypothetical protein